MKKQIILGTLALALTASANAKVAVSTIETNSTYLLAGWDFDNVLTWNGTNSGARYSDVYGDSSSTSRHTAGRVWFDGTKGSDNWGSNLAKASNGQVNQQLDTRGPSPVTDYIGALTGGEGSISFNSVQETTRDTLVLQVFNGAALTGTTDSAFSGFGDIRVDFEGRINGADSSVIGPYTINWAYSFDGVNFTNTDVTTTIDTSVNSVFSSYTADLSGVSGLETDGITALYLRMDIDKLGASGTRSLNIDNLAVYGAAVSAVPEPSTYAALCGLAGLGFAAWRRRSVKQA
jgi:hypothetical protein